VVQKFQLLTTVFGSTKSPVFDGAIGRIRLLPCKHSNRDFMSKVVIADDEGELRGLIAEALTQQGCQVFQASDGLEALELIETTAGVTLLLSDVRMPRMDGYLLAEKALAQSPELKILMLTGYAIEQPPSSVLRAREVRVLRKPFELSRLCQLVGDMLARP